jgi:hypothetical protein
MSTRSLTRRTVEPEQATSTRPAAPATWTTAGALLQVVWSAVIAYLIWASYALPEHPPAPAVVELLSAVVGWAILASAGGLLLRRRWALWTSVALALPMVGFAVMCFTADVGNHWIAEAGFAVAITGLSLHPASWRMHSR